MTLQASAFSRPLCALAHSAIRTQSTLLRAKKKRKRKSPSDSSDLPDFDLEDDDADASSKINKPSKAAASEITSAMMGSANKPTRSIRDLLSDRSLEKAFVFDEPADSSLPDLAQIPGAGQGKKKTRQAARIAAAEAAKREAEETSFLSNLPFVTDENGKVTPIKLIEAGTWAGIILLVVWEVYINTPLFDRAAPISPVVY
jgi:hypothetical protein